MKKNYAKEIYNHLVSSIEIKNEESEWRSNCYTFDIFDGQAKVRSWGAHDFIKIDDLTLQFRVNGLSFAGFVQISYCPGEDLYILRFISQDSLGAWKIFQEFKEVFLYQLRDVIDNYMGGSQDLCNFET
jgi:hypothetical protein